MKIFDNKLLHPLICKSIILTYGVCLPESRTHQVNKENIEKLKHIQTV